MISDRERSYLKRFIAAGKLHDERPLDLFREKEVLARRKTHLIFVIQRQALRLNIDPQANLDTKTDLELESIRAAFSKQIAESKDRHQQMEMANA